MENVDPRAMSFGAAALSGTLLALGLELNGLIGKPWSLFISMLITAVVPMLIALIGRWARRNLEVVFVGYWMSCVVICVGMIVVGLEVRAYVYFSRGT